MLILLTGSFGFLGRHIADYFLKLNNTILSLGLEKENEVICDLSVNIPLIKNEVEIVIHSAGKAHSDPITEKEKQTYFDINFNGTKNLCLSLEKSTIPKAFIFISTTSVYGVSKGENVDEGFPLMGTSAYALSKIKAEEYLTNWCQKNSVKLGILRPSLIAGKNPIGTLGAMINGIKNGMYYRIGNGSTRKSLIMATDVARAIPKLIEIGGVYNLCDSYHPSFAELDNLISKQLGLRQPKSIPYWVAKGLALVGDIKGPHFPINSDKLEKIVNTLTFSNEKARRELNWEPLDVLKYFTVI